MTREEFDTIVERTLQLWPVPSFKRNWNGANQTIAFKKLSTFAQHEVIDCLENHRYDNPDAREPKFQEIAAKLWAVKKSRAAKSEDQCSVLPSWPVIKTWSDRKSDDDLDHLFRVLDERYSAVANVHDKLWPLVASLDRRSNGLTALLWAIEHDHELTFRRGSDEWHAIMDEYDRRERARSVDEYRTKRVPVKLAPYPAEKRIGV